jgi:threonine dehydratase
MGAWPIQYADVVAAKKRIAALLTETRARNYPVLDELVGHDLEIWVKHENDQPTGSFKIRNGLSATSALSSDEKARGVVAASRGNHGQGVAYAGKLLGIATTIFVPEGNSPSKNRAMRKLGASLVEGGRDYDESMAAAQEHAREGGRTLVHSTNDPNVIAGAGTIALEFLDQVPDLDALVVAVGGGSQAVGSLTVARENRPALQVFGVQAAKASAIHDGYHAGHEVQKDTADTFADGLATRSCYPTTFPALCEGLVDFVTVSEGEIAEAIRRYLRGASTLAEGAGAAGLAGAAKLGPRLAGKKVGVILSGGNIDLEVLQSVLDGSLGVGAS